MYTLRRWWSRHGLRLGLLSLTLVLAWSVRQSQGVFIYELYQWLGRPFQTDNSQIDYLQQAGTLELQQRLIELESENQRLQQLLDAAAENPQPGITAKVIGRSADHWWQQITLGKGAQDGIEINDVVTAPGGLVGRVLSVTPHTSQVLLISDPTSRAGVAVSRSRSMGYMRGQSANRATVKFFDKVPDVRPGDVISTSAFSQLFPAGLPIGMIESIDLNKSPAPEAVVKLAAPISILEWVIVYPGKTVNEIPDLDALDLDLDQDAPSSLPNQSIGGQ